MICIIKYSNIINNNIKFITLIRSLSLILKDIHPLSITKDKYNINNYPKSINKMEWNEVKDIINTNRLELLGRNEEQQKVYEAFR